ncbi:MAG: hypothetical protein LUQ69_03295 [Methanoregulaceae archaeon]|nr:hypothetical protein [Methanoregulaceae archaeon]
MKIFAILVLLIIITASLVLPVSGELGDPTAMVTEFTVQPKILSPGSLGTISVVIQIAGKTSVTETTANTGKSEEPNVNIERVSLEGNGLTVVSDAFDHVGRIGQGQSIPLSFTIRAPEEGGMYYPEIRIATAGGSTRYPIPVNVDTPIGIQREAILVVMSYPPDTVNPGDEIPVRIILRNEGQTLAEEVTLKIENDSTLIAPKTANFYHIGQVNGGEEKSVDLVLLSDRSANPGLIRVPVTVQYTWIDGSVHSDTTSIDVMMKGEAELGFVSVDTSPRRVIANQPFDLTIRIENTGTGEAKQVAATVDLPVTGTKESFIGKIKPGNDAPAVFMLDGVKGGTYNYTTSITYTDDLGTHTITKPMSVRVVPEDYTGAIIAVSLILIAGGFIVYRYWYLPRKNGNGAIPWVKKN